ncbi:cytochrome P450 [Streptomyces sp. SLBN-118]|uniref:cytochrome P450 n=1 Tax=Streptomyces sp. SLBN-118 TaxID=2768454 RepID=UPI0011524D24|nr:cytochrome P450 [Streptomyces sp. SLBN-118]
MHVFDPEILLTEKTALDPYPVFARMRALDPVHWNEPTNSWYVTTYGDVARLLREESLSACPGDYTGPQRDEDRPEVEEAMAFFNSWMVFSDPPHQTRLRETVAPAFPRRSAEAWAGHVRRTARELLNAVGEGETDLFDAFAAPLAVRLTCAVLGVPEEDVRLVQDWSSRLIGFLSTPTADPVRARIALRARDDLRKYLQDTVIPGLRATDDERLIPLRGIAGLDPEDALALFAQLLTGGIDPVASALATTADVLLRWDPEARAEALARPELLEAVVEEALRYDAPFHFVPRSTTVPLEVGGRTVPAGRRLVLVIASANRDEAVYEGPDAFRPGRGGPRHLSFGLGRHYCLGALLSRVILREGVLALLERLDGTEARPLAAVRTPAFGVTTWQRLMVAV